MPKPTSAKPAEPGTWEHQGTRRRVLVAGILGAVASVAVKPIKAKGFYHFLTGGDMETWALCAGLALLGLLLVWLFQECNINKALCITAGFPALVINMTSDPPHTNGVTEGVPAVGTQPAAPSRPPSPEGDVTMTWPGAERVPGLNLFALLVSTAQAQSSGQGVVETTNGQPRSMEFYSDTKIAFRLECLDAQQEVLKGWDVKEAEAGFKAVIVPAGTAYVRAQCMGASSPAEPLQAGAGDGTIEVGVSIRKDASLRWQDVLGKAASPALVVKLSVNARPKAPVGKEGWVFLGSRAGNAWKTTYATPLPVSAPSTGTVLTATYPLNVRDAAGSKNPPQAIISKGQQFEVQSVTLGDKTAWAKVKISNTNNPAP